MVAAIKNGDELAFQQAFFLYQKKLHAFFLKKCCSGDDASDMVQTVFLKLWQYRGSLNEEYELGQHIFQIARTVFIDYLRRQNKHAYSLREDLTTIPQPAGGSVADLFDIRQKLGLALQEMPEMRKRVFELSRIEGYSYLEIATLFSISVKSVDNHVSKAVRHLRKVFVWVSVLAGFLYEGRLW